ncbi:hypothetical protein [Spirochaeta dissipatitropha]
MNRQNARCQDDGTVILTSLTCDRLTTFTQSLETLGPAVMGNDAGFRLLVCDGSHSPETIQAKKDLLEEKNQQWNCAGQYWGIQEKLCLSESLKKIMLDSRNCEQVHPDSVDFFLFGSNKVPELKAPGANQNSQLALSAGKSLVSFDDDVFLRPRQLKPEVIIEADRFRELIAGAFHCEKLFMEISEPWNGNVCHELTEHLGTSCVQTDPHTGIKTEGLIRGTNTGFYGGRWFDVPFSLLTIKQPFRQSIEAGKSSYAELKSRPYCFTQSDKLLVPNPLTFAGAMAIDCRTFVPPFFPHLRMQEHIWQTLLGACHPGACTAALPFMLFHNGEDKQAFTTADYQNVGSSLGRHVLTTLNGLIATLYDESPGSPTDYEYFGQALLDLSGLSYREWMLYCRKIWMESVIPGIQSFQHLLHEHHGKPRYWARDVNRFISRIKNGMNDPGDFIPRELQISGSAETAHETWQHLFRKWGQLLMGWPVIWNAIAEWHRIENPWVIR